MPYIFKNKKKPEYNYNINNDNFNYVYNTRQWKKLRLFYLSKNPLCKHCELKGIITSATEAHHKIPLSTYDDIEKKLKIGFDITNLEGLCKKCHIEHHQKNKLKK